MRRKSLILLIVVLIVATGVVLGLTLGHRSAVEPMTFNQAQSEAVNQTDLPACLDLQAQNWPNNTDGETITKVVGAELTNRPKTIAYSVNFKFFNNQNATGTIIYDGTSDNTFNFTVSHTKSASVWQLTRFQACK